MTPPDTAARAELTQAIATLGRLLPNGMRVLFYRPEESLGDLRVAVETTNPSGEVTQHWATELLVH